MPLELVQIAPPQVDVGFAEDAFDEGLSEHDDGFCSDWWSKVVRDNVLTGCLNQICQNLTSFKVSK